MTRSVARMLLAYKAAGWGKWVLVVRRELQSELQRDQKRAAGLAEVSLV